MRTLLVAIATLLGIQAANGETATPEEIIDRAMKAQTDKPEDLAKRRMERIQMEGLFHNTVPPVPIAREVIIEGPDRVRYNNTFKYPQGEQRLILCLNKTRVWRANSDGQFQEDNLSIVDEFQAEAHGKWVSTLFPLKEKSFTLTALLDSRIEGEDVQVIKASTRFRPDVLLFFSKKSGLLVKVSYKTTESGVAVRKEHIYGDYRKFDGVLLPGRIVDVVSGNKTADYKVKEYKFLDKQPAGIFEKPDVK